MAKLALVRVRGIRRIRPEIVRTLEFLRLNKPNHCVIVDDAKQTLGMINVVKDYIAYGTVDEKTILMLLRKRGKKGARMLRDVMSEDEIKSAAKEISGGRKVAEFADPVFALTPPRKGYKSIKLPYPDGDLGRRDDINPLLRRMM